MPRLTTEWKLPGEDCTIELQLEVDLIPSRSWFQNVRAAVNPRDWDLLRFSVFARAAYLCELCGANDEPLECHERFAYMVEAGGKTGVQRLLRLLALCKKCHLATHYGLATILGIEREAAEHIIRVRDWSEDQVYSHINDSVAQWERRNEIAWIVDISIITAGGYRLRGICGP